MKNKIDLQDLTFLIPIRLDSIERVENLRAITDCILDNFITNIIILEAAPLNNGLLKKYVKKDKNSKESY